MRFNPVIFLFLLAITVSAETQDSLFERALDAESSGDVTATIDLLERAAACKGPYDAEIHNILNSYYEALGVDTSSSGFDKNFVAKLEGGGYGYNEYGDTAGASELSAETYLLLGGGFTYRTESGLEHSVMVSLASDLFFREKETVFDTSRWAFTPELEYTLQGIWFAAGADVDFYVSERDGFVPAFSLFGERDFYQNGSGTVRSGFYSALYASTSGRARFQLSLYFERHPEHGFWFYTGLGGRFERDTVVDVYFEGYGSAGYPSYAAEDSSGWENGSGADTVRQLYYAGRPSSLGPELRLFGGYKFSDAWALSFRGSLYEGFALRKDSWLAPAGDSAAVDGNGQPLIEDRTYSRKSLLGYGSLRGEWKYKNFSAYASLEAHFLRYQSLPGDHPELTSYASIWKGIRLGTALRF